MLKCQICRKRNRSSKQRKKSLILVNLKIQVDQSLRLILERIRVKRLGRYLHYDFEALKRSQIICLNDNRSKNVLSEWLVWV